MLTKSEMADAIISLVKDIEPDIRLIVGSIQSSEETTMNHYGDYMAAISKLSKGNRGVAILVAYTMIGCGADQKGVTYALQLITDGIRNEVVYEDR
jgi:hypothetical protein